MSVHDIIYSYPSSPNAEALGMSKTGCYALRIEGRLDSGHQTYEQALEAAKSAGTEPGRWSMDHPLNARFLVVPNEWQRRIMPGDSRQSRGL